MNTSLRISYRGIYLGIALLIAHSLRALKADELDDLFREAMAGPVAIESYAFSVTEVSVGADGTTKPLTKDVQFCQSGDMFRSDIHWRVANTIGDRIQAFNGLRYQQFFDKRKLLSYSAKNRHIYNPYFSWNPLVVPYLWMLKPDYNWSNLKDPQLWAAKRQQAQLVGHEVVHSHKCTVVSVPYELNAGTTATVFFAKDLGWYPIRVTGVSSAPSRFEINTLRYLSIDTDGIKVPLPLVLTMKSVDKTEQSFELTVAPDSVKINPHIPDDTFTLSPSMAKNVDNYDRNMERMLKAAVPEMEQGGKSQRTALALIIGNVVVILVLIVLYFSRRVGHASKG